MHFSKTLLSCLMATAGARRTADSAALLVDEVLPEQPMRQWVLSFPFPLRFRRSCAIGGR